MRTFSFSLYALVAVSTASIKLTSQDHAAIQEGLRSGVIDHVDRAPAIVSHVERRRVEASLESYPAIVDETSDSQSSH